MRLRREVEHSFHSGDLTAERYRELRGVLKLQLDEIRGMNLSQLGLESAASPADASHRFSEAQAAQKREEYEAARKYVESVDDDVYADYLLDMLGEEREGKRSGDSGGRFWAKIRRRPEISDLEVAAFLALVFAFLFGPYLLNGPHPTGRALERINVSAEPVQEMNITAAAIMLPDGVILTPRAKYSLSGKVVAKYWYDSALTYMFTKWVGIDAFEAETIPLDLCIVWGDLAAPEYEDSLSYRMVDADNTDFGRRVRGCQPAYNPGKPLPSTKDFPNQITNNHLIPANDNVYAAMTRIGVGDEVVIDGYLVDVGGMKTSLARNDRGCEIIYVERIRLGRDVYS